MAKKKNNIFNVDNMMAYESDELSRDKQVKFFADGIKSGQIYQLQGHYGRTAQMYIDSGLITPEGKITTKGKEYMKEQKDVYGGY